MPAFSKNECLIEKQIIIDQQKEIRDAREQSKICKASKITLTDKLGLVGVGAVLAVTQFNPFVIIGVGYIVLFQ